MTRCWTAERKYTTSGLGNHVDKRRTATEKVLTSLANEAVRESLGPLRTESVSQSPSTTMFSSTPPTPAISYSLGGYLCESQLHHRWVLVCHPRLPSATASVGTCASHSYSIGGYLCVAHARHQLQPRSVLMGVSYSLGGYLCVTHARHQLQPR